MDGVVEERGFTSEDALTSRVSNEFSRMTRYSRQQQFGLGWLNTRHVEYDTTIMLKNAAIPLDVKQAIRIRVSPLVSILNFAVPLEFIASRSS
jgi:hypothetical protein